MVTVIGCNQQQGSRFSSSLILTNGRFSPTFAVRAIVGFGCGKRPSSPHHFKAGGEVFRVSVSEIEVHPVVQGNWNDLAMLFEARGGPHYCWCSLYRFSGAEAPTAKTEKKSSLERLVSEAVPVGVLAYDGDRPVGWCSIAPRETYQKLKRSRTMPRVTDSETSTWTILCFFVHREYRGRHVASALLEGAVTYARTKGAQVVEGYPFDSAGITATHRGHSKIFEGAGFQQDDHRWYLDLKVA